MQLHPHACYYFSESDINIAPSTMNIQVAPKPRRKQNPAAVKQNIIDVAIKEFSANGLAGSSVNVIAEKTDTSKRMIYYYFGGKSELYRPPSNTLTARF